MMKLAEIVLVCTLQTADIPTLRGCFCTSAKDIVTQMLATQKTRPLTLQETYDLGNVKLFQGRNKCKV